MKIFGRLESRIVNWSRLSEDDRESIRRQYPGMGETYYSSGYWLVQDQMDLVPGLNAALDIVEGRISAGKAVGYNRAAMATLEEVKVFLQASISRLTRGEEYLSYSVPCDDHKPVESK